MVDRGGDGDVDVVCDGVVLSGILELVDG